MLFTPISPRIIYSVEVENQPTLSLRYRWVQPSRAKPCHNLSFSANTGSIYPALSFTRAPLPSSFSLFDFSVTPFNSAHLPPSSLLPFFCFHYCCTDMAACDCSDWVEHMYCKMLTWCTGVYTEDDKLRLDAVILSFICLMSWWYVCAHTHAHTHQMSTPYSALRRN